VVVHRAGFFEVRRRHPQGEVRKEVIGYGEFPNS
jgi:hypothetical protein